jgi:hypothetical protein
MTQAMLLTIQILAAWLLAGAAASVVIFKTLGFRFEVVRTAAREPVAER